MVVNTRTSFGSFSVESTTKYALPFTAAPWACAPRSAPSRSRSHLDSFGARHRGEGERNAAGPSAQRNLAVGDAGTLSPSHGHIRVGLLSGSWTALAAKSSSSDSSFVPTYTTSA